MCGISGILQGTTGAPLCLADLRTMHDLLASRGPDGEGCLIVDARGQGTRLARLPAPADASASPAVAAVAFRRLAIQDPRAEGNQPLAHGSARRWIVHNGEIYNFPELRQELQSEGHVFRTGTDSEVALAAYERWGPECFGRFHGMWAMLIVDLERGVLIGSRDRLGIKPLFYCQDGDRLLLASEPRALAAVQRGGPRVAAGALAGFLRGGPSQVAAFSLFTEIRPVPPATWFEIALRGDAPTAPRFRTYWRLSDHVCAEPAPGFAQASEQFAQLLHASVAEHLVSDVPVGSLLSGGLDSSMLTRLMALARRDQPHRPAVFSIVFDDPAMDESHYIDAVLDLGGVEGHRTRLDAHQAWNLVDEVTAAYGEPLLGHYLVAYYHLLRSVRAGGLTVVLDGQGADELLGGYNPMEAAALRERLGRGEWRAFALELGLLARQSRRSRWAVLRGHVLGPWRHALWERFGAQPDEPRYPWLEARRRDDPRRDAAAAADDSRDRSPLNRLAHRLTRHTNLPYLLLFLDRLSMAHGVELRVPYLDHRLVEFCFRMPARHKVAGGERKRLLRQMARAHLPPLVTDRSYKMGISSNLRWLPRRDLHAEPLRAMASSPTMRQLPMVRPSALTGFVETFLAGRHDDALAVWRLYTAWRWLEIFRPTVVPAAS